MRLDGRVALITGGTSGIGKATALLFAREGARIVITGRDASRGQAVVDEIMRGGGAAIFVAADVRVAVDCWRAVDTTVKTFGRIDILFNNAGVFSRKRSRIARNRNGMTRSMSASRERS